MLRSIFRETRVDVVVVDAAHDFASVAQDLRNILSSLPSVEWVVLHDYGVENEKEGIVDGLQVRFRLTAIKLCSFMFFHLSLKNKKMRRLKSEWRWFYVNSNWLW